MEQKYDLYQTQNLRYELPIFNIKEHPTIKWKTRIMRKSTYPGKHIAIRIVAAKHLLNKTITQMARKAWETVYNNPKFKSNVLRGVHWQRLLQWNLLERSVENDANLKNKQDFKSKSDENIIKVRIQNLKSSNTSIKNIWEINKSN